MLRLTNLSCPLETAEADYAALAAKKLRVAETEVLSVRLWKKSIDARDKADVHLVLTLDVTLRDEARTLKKLRPGTAAPVVPEKPLALPAPRFALRPVVAGAGPAGLFAALTLAQAGARPILVERGRAVEERTRDVDAFRRAGALDPESNVQFGEGGAGAFSDGKLTTGTKSPLQRHVLGTFVRHGAPEDILWLQKPHIGSDNLPKVVASMRREILALGGEDHGPRRAALRHRAGGAGRAGGASHGQADPLHRAQRRGHPARPLPAGGAHGAEALRHRCAHRAAPAADRPGALRALRGASGAAAGGL